MHKISSTINSFFRLQFRQYVTVAEDSWMLNANGLVRFMTLRCSPIQKSTKISKRNIPNTALTVLPGYDAISNYLIGNPAYPLTSYCIKEFTSCSKNEEVIFNNMLRSARNQVECAFGRLKARWGFLRKEIDLKIETVPKFIYSCFVLHNF